jgi:hypothetical protein
MAGYSELMAFEVEIEHYNELLPELLESSEGKFVVIKGRELLGVFDSNDDAYGAGLDAYGLTSFLLRPIRKTQPVFSIPALQLGILRGRI